MKLGRSYVDLFALQRVSFCGIQCHVVTVRYGTPQPAAVMMYVTVHYGTPQPAAVILFPFSSQLFT